jgi:hypothetical protein
MSAEYESLRAEMHKWQDRRFDLLKHGTAVVTGLLGFKIITGGASEPGLNAPEWPLISIVLLLYLATINLLTWYSGVANSKLAAYIKIFHEAEKSGIGQFKWESRLDKLKSRGLDSQSLNRWIAVTYLVLGIVSVGLPYASPNQPMERTPPCCALRRRSSAR